MNAIGTVHLRTPAREVLAAGVLVVAIAALLLPAIAHAIDLWSTTEEFSYGFLVVPIAVALIVRRAPSIRAAAGTGDRRGVPIVVVSMLVYVVAERIGIHAVAGLAISPLLWGIALYLWGPRVAFELAFPLAFLAFGFAAYRGLLDTLGFALQVATAEGAGLLAGILRLPVMREDLVLHLPAFAFVVAEACSGMSSLLSLLALSSIWVYVAAGRPVARVVVLASVLPIVLLANVVRVTLVLLVADRLGPDMALGFFHGASSLVLFAVAVVALIGASRLVGCRISVAR